MQIVGWVLAILLGVGWAASEFSAPVEPAPPPAAPAWRRTADGWERLKPRPAPLVSPGFHPALLAALLGVGSTLALGAFSNRRSTGGRSLVISDDRKRAEPAEISPEKIGEIRSKPEVIRLT